IFLANRVLTFKRNLSLVWLLLSVVLATLVIANLVDRFKLLMLPCILQFYECLMKTMGINFE
ncbi:MAG: hypothetical protein V4440_05380, partial [Pseudomonadota bacterium]